MAPAMMTNLFINTCQVIHPQILKYKSCRKFRSTKLTVSERERVDLKWIKELDTAAPYGLYDKINGDGALTSPSTSEEAQNWHLQQTSKKEKKPWSSKNNLSF